MAYTWLFTPQEFVFLLITVIYASASILSIYARKKQKSQDNQHFIHFTTASSIGFLLLAVPINNSTYIFFPIASFFLILALYFLFNQWCTQNTLNSNQIQFYRKFFFFLCFASLLSAIIFTAFALFSSPLPTVYYDACSFSVSFVTLLIIISAVLLNKKSTKLNRKVELTLFLLLFLASALYPLIIDHGFRYTLVILETSSFIIFSAHSIFLIIYFIIYLKDSPLRIKFIAPFLISILFILGGLNIIVIDSIYNQEEKIRLNTVKLIQRAIRNNIFPPLPDSIEYIILLSEGDKPFQIVFQKNSVLMDNFLHGLIKNNVTINIKTLKFPENTIPEERIFKYVTYYPPHLILSSPIIFGYRFYQYGNEYEVGFSQNDFSSTLEPFILSSIAQSVISVTLIMVVISLLLNINLTQPIHQLINGLKAAQDGNYETKLPIFANDEIGYLTHAFNDFIYTIHIAQLSLKQANADLELRVEQRTAELEIVRLVTETLNQEINLYNAIKAGLEMTMSLMNATSGWVFLLDAYQKPFLATAFSLANEQFIHNSLDDDGQTQCECIAKLFTDSFSKPEWIEHCIYQKQGHVSVYLHHGKTKLGILNLCLPKDYPLSENEVNVLNTIGEALSAAIVRAKLYESEKEQRSIAETLQETAIAFSSTLNIDQVLDQILEQTARLIPYDSANVMLIEDNKAIITRTKGYEKFGEKTNQIAQWMSFDIDKTYNLKTILETKQPLIIPNTRQDPHWLHIDGTEHIHSWIGAPLLSHNKILGILCLDKVNPNFYTTQHENLIKTIAIQAGLGLENATLYSNSLKDLFKEQQLHNISRAISYTFDIDRALHKVTSLTIELFNADDGFIGILDKNKIPPTITQYFFPPKSSIAQNKGLLKIIHDLVTEKVVVLKKAIIINSPTQNEQFINLTQPIQAILCAPLISGEISLGYIYIHHTQPRKKFHQRDKNQLESLGRQIGTAIENARLFDEVQRLAKIDSLTGINNRSNLFHLGIQEIDRAIRYQHPLSILMIDIDHFKKVNDTYGHTAGDQVLQAMVNKCVELCRKVDTIGRYGGEEFVIILPETDLEEARVVAERLRENIASMETVVDNLHKIKITISIGVTSITPLDYERKYTTDIFENLLEQADQALYKAKRDGRNCVRVYSFSGLSNNNLNGE